MEIVKSTVPNLQRKTKRSFHWQPYLFILPTLMAVVLFNIYPFFSGFYYAFFQWDGISKAHFVAMQNFKDLLHDEIFIKSIPHMLVYLIGSCAKVIFPLMVALFIFHIRSAKMSYMFKVLFVLPIIVPFTVWILLWQDFLSFDGLVDKLLQLAGLGDWSRDWLSDKHTALGSLLFVGVRGMYAGFPFISPLALLVLMAALISISSDLFDAVRIDGANVWQRFWHLELPSILPQLLVVITLSIIDAIQDFQTFLVLTNGGPANATMVPGLYMYQQALGFSNVGYANAIGVLLFMFLFALTYMNRKLQKRAQD